MARTTRVYLLHFERPISEHHTTQHYIGSAADVAARLEEHRSGRGARLTQVAVERGIGFEVVREWAGGRDMERTLKNRKNAPKLCPLCAQRLAS
jgi:predicted GIY-YIG superfamily endonuclease